MDAVAKFPAVTHVGPAEHAIHDGPLPGLLSREEAVAELYRQALSGQMTLSSPQDAVAALAACIGALSAGETGNRVTFPIDPDSELGRREWPIS